MQTDGPSGLSQSCLTRTVVTAKRHARRAATLQKRQFVHAGIPKLAELIEQIRAIDER